MALGIAGFLLLGTASLFVVQEALPAWRWRKGRLEPEHLRNARLDASLARVEAAYERARLRRRRGRAPIIRLMQTSAPVAGLQGLVEPKVVVSKGLYDQLDDEELDAAVAHELAHLLRGGNLRTLGLWAVRALQAASPGALVLFRTLLEAEEAACDALAAYVTRRPAALASALLKAHGQKEAPSQDASPMRRARFEVLRRADIASTRLRVQTLLRFDRELPVRTPRLLLLLFSAAFGALLWGIG